MQISQGIRIIDLALYLEEFNTLVIGDVHLGFEESLNRKGVLVPRFQYKDTIERLKKIILQLKEKPKEIVINGDLKHEFGEISEQEWREILKFIDFLSENCERIVLVKGNHDVILYPIARKRNIGIAETYSIGKIFISHGHTIPESEEFRKSKIILIGDEHPAVTLKEGGRAELYKCFLKGKWKGKELIIMPSFNQVTIGKDILRERFQTPFMQQKLISDFKLYVAGDKVYDFGKAEDLK